MFLSVVTPQTGSFPIGSTTGFVKPLLQLDALYWNAMAEISAMALGLGYEVL
jgi:hypothetical protein